MAIMKMLSDIITKRQRPASSKKLLVNDYILKGHDTVFFIFDKRKNFKTPLVLKDVLRWYGTLPYCDELPIEKNPR